MKNRRLEELAKEGQIKRITKMKSAIEKYSVKLLNKEIIVFPNVFYPGKDTTLLIETIKVQIKDRVLEPFAGTGAIAIFLAQQVSKVVTTDINPKAIENIKQNAKFHNLENKIEAIQADIFPEREYKFDIIVANPPYTNNTAKDIIEKSVWDKDHATTIKFFKNAKKYLSKNGKIYCSWANFADFSFFEKIIKENNYSVSIVSEISDEWITYRVYEITSLIN